MTGQAFGVLVMLQVMFDLILILALCYIIDLLKER